MPAGSTREDEEEVPLLFSPTSQWLEHKPRIQDIHVLGLFSSRRIYILGAST